MNRRSRQLIIDAMIAIILSTILTFVTYSLGYHLSLMMLFFEWGIIPIIWFSFRQGPVAAVLIAAIQGLISGLIIWYTDGFEHASLFMFLILGQVLPYISLSVAGFFAKYTQKTLNNRRYSSTYLNIVTGTTLAVLAYYFIRFVLIPWVFRYASELNVLDGGFWLSAVIIAALTFVVLCLMARLKAQTIIPKRSKYLSRKETSSLLND
ncbi:energy-coupled thiamine transporter ThiT [Fundicoccus sp. Sow4_H7]|uniref:energy-coupled thiamine transporter ThiT n=1 Tax=Fundicoccus sp. Sow4_H7 TaxID=3438784 RepID=UPI003F914FB0